MLRSRKLEAQQKARKELEEKQRRREEEQRQEAERRLKEQQESERRESEIRSQREQRESQLRAKQTAVFSEISKSIKNKVAEHDEIQWENKKFQWSMRCDGLPDPLNLPQLNTYKYRWTESSLQNEPSLSLLIARLPELIQVIRDLDDLLEDIRDTEDNLTVHLQEMRHDLTKLMIAEIDSTIFGILSDVQVHLPADESVLNLQNSNKSFCLALGCDTSRNSNVKTYNFSQLGIKINLPSAVLGISERPVALSLVWLQEIHQLNPPKLNGVRSLPSLFTNKLYKAPPRGAEIKTNKADSVDLDIFMPVGGFLQIDILELPVQPKKYRYYIVAPLDEEKRASRVQYRATLNTAIEFQNSDEQAKDSDYPDKEARELEDELGKLITITMKLPNWCLWMEPPKPVRYTELGWTFSGIWDVRFQEQTGGPCVHFRLEEPSIIGLAQARRVNLPIQGWSLFPGHVSRLQWTTKNKPFAENKLEQHITENPGGEGGEGAGGSSKWEGGGGWDAGDLESLDEEEDAQQAELEQIATDKTEEEIFDEEINVAILTVNGALATYELEIRESDVRLRLVRTSNSTSLQELYGKPMTPYELIKVLRNRGLEICPNKNICSQVEDLPAKDEVLERKTYESMAMALASKRFAFQWSRWNGNAGIFAFIFQLHALDYDIENLAQLVQVTSDRVRLLPFQETSQSFEELNLSIIDSKFYVDLYNALLEESPRDEVKRKLRDVSPLFVNNMYTMLSALKLLSAG